MIPRRMAPLVVLLVLGGAGLESAGCSEGTTPVCDDAGSCLIVPASGDSGGVPDTGTVEAGDDGGGGGGDAAAE